MPQEPSRPKNEEAEEDWLVAPMRRAQEIFNASGIWITYKEEVPPAFIIDDTPLAPAEEIKACSILNPNCDVCQ